MNTTAKYAVEEVECPACDGLGEDIYAAHDPFSWHGNRCVSCFGTGYVTVCANCLDWDNDCPVCMPVSVSSAAAVPKDEERDDG